MQFYMGENIAVFSEKKAKTAIHPAMPEISTLNRDSGSRIFETSGFTHKRRNACHLKTHFFGIGFRLFLLKMMYQLYTNKQ